MEDRLLKLLDTEQLTSAKFADAIGVQRSSVSHILSGRNKPSFDFLQKTLKVFPMLNADWLILGEGNMYEGDVNPISGSLFDQVPARRGVESSSSTDPAAAVENDQDVLKAPGGDISDRIDPEVEKSYSADGKEEGDDQIQSLESEGKGAVSKSPIEKESLIEADGKSLKTISRVIVFYTDKTFESYEKGD